MEERNLCIIHLGVPTHTIQPYDSRVMFLGHQPVIKDLTDCTKSLHSSIITFVLCMHVSFYVCMCVYIYSCIQVCMFLSVFLSVCLNVYASVVHCQVINYHNRQKISMVLLYILQFNLLSGWGSFFADWEENMEEEKRKLTELQGSHNQALQLS